MKDKIIKHKKLLTACVLLLLVVLFWRIGDFFWQNTNNDPSLKIVVASSTTKELISSSTPVLQNKDKDLLDTYPKLRVNPEPFPELTTDLYAVFFTDGRSQKYLKENRATEAVPIASITKLLTAIIALNASAYDSITISPQALLGEGSYGRYQVGDTFYLTEAVKSMLTESDNDVARQLCRDSGLNILPKMNDFATYIGLTDATFYSCSGIDNENGGMNVASARDVIVLLRYLVNNRSEFFTGQRISQPIYNIDGSVHHLAQSTYFELVSDLPFKTIAAKTGTEVVAKENIVVALQTPKGLLYISLLSSLDRKGDLQKITNWLYNSYGW